MMLLLYMCTIYGVRTTRARVERDRLDALFCVQRALSLSLPGLRCRRRRRRRRRVSDAAGFQFTRKPRGEVYAGLRLGGGYSTRSISHAWPSSPLSGPASSSAAVDPCLPRRVLLPTTTRPLDRVVFVQTPKTSKVCGFRMRPLKIVFVK